MPFEGRTISTDAAAEIVGKKLFYRTAGFKVRDVFDLAVVLAREPDAAGALRGLLGGKRAQLRRRLRTLERGFLERAASEIDLLPAGRPYLYDALASAVAFVEE
jgi:hypothetical protein